MPYKPMLPELVEVMVGLWEGAGCPTLRRLAAKAHVSSSTVYYALHGRMVGWRTLVKVVEQLTADPLEVNRVKGLWIRSNVHNGASDHERLSQAARIEQKLDEILELLRGKL